MIMKIMNMNNNGKTGGVTCLNSGAVPPLRDSNTSKLIYYITLEFNILTLI